MQINLDDPSVKCTFEWTTTFLSIESYRDWVNHRDRDTDVALERLHQTYKDYCRHGTRANFNWFTISSDRRAYEKWCHAYSYLFDVHQLALPSYELFVAVLKVKCGEN
jgi:hypothetical protein